jgi:hypothetical protein
MRHDVTRRKGDFKWGLLAWLLGVPIPIALLIWWLT